MLETHRNGFGLAKKIFSRITEARAPVGSSATIWMSIEVARFGNAHAGPATPKLKAAAMLTSPCVPLLVCILAPATGRVAANVAGGGPVPRSGLIEVIAIVFAFHLCGCGAKPCSTVRSCSCSAYRFTSGGGVAAVKPIQRSLSQPRTENTKLSPPDAMASA